MEKEVAERRRVNASNQEDPEEVEAELRQIEEKIDVEREALFEQVKEFQKYLEKQIVDEKSEARQLKAEQDELEAHEQQLLHTAVEDENDADENEQTRLYLNEQLRNPMPRQGLPTGCPAPTPTDLTNKQLKAELARLQSQRDADRQALDEANELLA